jgi:hypothetical protein
VPAYLPYFVAHFIKYIDQPVTFRVFKVRYVPVLSCALFRKQRFSAIGIYPSQYFVYILDSEIKDRSCM